MFLVQENEQIPFECLKSTYFFTSKATPEFGLDSLKNRKKIGVKGKIVYGLMKFR